ncbi:hypothetical protein [uncultured Paracoccus sp.]|uniref:hypothetical protein n=1 Tax=uncultured Paracoccus sp. TaxID=189685 RepID=UPI003453A373
MALLVACTSATKLLARFVTPLLVLTFASETPARIGLGHVRPHPQSRAAAAGAWLYHAETAARLCTRGHPRSTTAHRVRDRAHRGRRLDSQGAIALSWLLIFLVVVVHNGLGSLKTAPRVESLRGPSQLMPTAPADRRGHDPP